MYIPRTAVRHCEISLASAQDVDDAVQAARAAFPAWRALPGDKRRDLMFKMAGLIEQHAKELAELSTLENGSPTMMAPFIAPDAAQKFRYFGGWADKIQGETISTWRAPAHNYVAYEPYGVDRRHHSVEWTAVCSHHGDDARARGRQLHRGEGARARAFHGHASG